MANSFVSTVISIPILTRLNLNEKIKTYNVCIDGISLVIAVEGLKGFHKSISKCSLTLTYLSFLLLPDQSLNSDHWTRLSLIDANDFCFQRDQWEIVLQLSREHGDSYTCICIRHNLRKLWVLVNWDFWISYTFQKAREDTKLSIVSFKRTHTFVLFYVQKAWQQ